MIGERVVRQRATTTTDRYGNVERDWSDPDELRIDGAAVAPQVAGEDREQGRQGVVVGWALFVQGPAPDVVPTDRVVARGQTYEVDGHPAEWINPYTGREAGVQIALRRVEG